MDGNSVKITGCLKMLAPKISASNFVNFVFIGVFWTPYLKVVNPKLETSNVLYYTLFIMFLKTKFSILYREIPKLDYQSLIFIYTTNTN